MGKLRFTLSNLVFYIIIGFSIFLFENLPFLNDGNMEFVISGGTFTFVTVVLIFLYVFYYFLEHKKNALKLDWLMLLVFSLLFLWMTASIWTNKEVTVFINPDNSFTEEVIITKWEKWRYTVELFLSFVFFYSFLFVFGKGRVRTRQFIWLPIGVMVSVFLISLSTIYFDFNIYKAIFTGGEIRECVQAFSGNENVLALWYLFGILASMIVAYRRPSWWAYTLMYYFLIVMVFTSCATTLIVGSIAVAIFTLVEIFARFKWNWRLAIILIFVLISVAGTFVGLYFLAKAQSWKLLELIEEYFKKYILNKDTKTFSHRTDIWSDVFSLLGKDIGRFLFGYGFRTDMRLFVPYFRVCKGYDVELAHVHNSYVAIILRHGIMGIIGYGIAIIYFFACCIKLFFKKNFRYGFTYILTCSTLLSYSYFEPATLFEPSCIGLLFLAMFFMPPIWAERTSRNKVQKNVLKLKPRYGELKPMTLSYVSSLVIYILFITVISSLLTPIASDSEFLRVLLLTSAAFLFITYLFYPYLLGQFKKKGSIRRFAWQVFLWTSFAVMMFIASFIVFTYVIKLPYQLVILISLSIYLVILLTSTLIYSLRRKGSFKEWVKFTFYGSIIVPGVSNLVILGFMPISVLAFSLMLEMNVVNFVIVFLTSFVLVLSVYLLLPNSKKDKLVNECNDASINRLIKLIRKDRI